MSTKRPWPPPHLYGVRAMALPASMILSTALGASSGGSATPLSSAVALRVPPLIALGVSPRSRVEDAGPVGFGVAGSSATPDSTRLRRLALARDGLDELRPRLRQRRLLGVLGRLDVAARLGRGAAAGERDERERADEDQADQKLVLLMAPALVRPMWMWLRWATVGSTRLRLVPCLLKQAA